MCEAGDAGVKDPDCSHCHAVDGVKVKMLGLGDPGHVGLVVAHCKVEGPVGIHGRRRHGHVEKPERVVGGEHVRKVPRRALAPVHAHVVDGPGVRRPRARPPAAEAAAVVVAGLDAVGAPCTIDALGPTGITVGQRFWGPRPPPVVLKDTVEQPVLDRVVVRFPCPRLCPSSMFAEARDQKRTLGNEGPLTAAKA